MKITKRRFYKETKFECVEGGQVFRCSVHPNNDDEYYMAFSEGIAKAGAFTDAIFNAIRLSDGQPMIFNAGDKAVIVENAELIINE